MGLIFMGVLLISLIYDIGALILAIIGLILVIIYAFNGEKR